MPLTIAHPAAVLPFRKSGQPWSALIAGSLAPDIEYFFHLAPRSGFSHTVAGLFFFCLPAGLITLWIFHRIWKRPMVAVLGKGHEHHGRPFTFGPFPRFLMLCCAILLGALIHIIWDSFTHDYGWFVRHVEGLRQRIHIIGRLEIPLYLILQHVSTLLGCGLLLFAAFHHRTWVWPHFVAHWPLLFVIGWLTIAGGVALGMLVAGDVSNAEGLKRWAGSGLVVAGLVMLLVTTFLCLVWHLRHRLEKYIL